MFKKMIWKMALTISMLLFMGWVNIYAADAICYNCPPKWADWASQLKMIKKHLGYDIPHDNKNSGQTLSQLLAEKNSPVADVAYYGVTVGILAGQKGVAAAYKPKYFNEIPDGLKDPQGKWFAIHSGTLGLFINVDALEGAPIPKSWSDLLKPAYKGMVGYLDPSSASVGYAGAVAVNRAMGGNLSNFDPGINYFKKLAKNDPIVPKQTSYGRVLSGEIPILFDYDFNAYRGKYTDKANVVFVIPQEGTIVLPYVMSLVKNGPHPEKGKKILDFIMSDDGQKVWANAFLRPIRSSALSAEAASKFLPASDYARAKPVNYGKMAAVQKSFQERYLSDVR